MPLMGKHFSAHLSKLQIEANYHVASELADDAEISAGYLSKLLSGVEYNPSRAVIRRIATVLAVRLVENKSHIKSKSVRLQNELEEARRKDMEEAGRE